MNGFKKAAAAAMSALVAISPLAAYANEITGCNIGSDYVLSVEGKLDKAVKDAYVNLYMRKNGSLVFVKQEKTDKNGGYNFAVDMSRFESGGVFDIKVTSQLKGENAAAETIEYYTDLELEDTYKDIFEKRNDISYIAEKMCGDYKDKMVFTSEFFRDILSKENSEDIAKFVSKEIKADTAAEKITDEVVRVLKITASIKMFEYSKDGEKIAENLMSDEMLETLGLKGSKVFDVFAKNLESDLNDLDADEDKDAFKKARYILLAGTIIGLNGSYTDCADFVSDMENAVVIADLSRCRGNDSLRAMLKNYSENAGVFDVSSLTDNALTEVLSKLEKGEIAKTTEIQASIDNHKNDSDDDGNNGGGGSSSKGSSGKSYSGGYVSTPSSSFDPDDIVKPEITGFKDMANFSWAKESVDKMVSLGMLDGYSKEEFAPQDNVTRAQFAKMMCNVFEMEKANSDGSFGDVAIGEWYEGFVYALKNAGYINGIDENTFGSDEYITRQDVFTIAYRILKDKNLIEKDVESAEFADWQDVADYAKAALATLSDMSLIKGDNGNIKPKDNMTRAEAAVIMQRIYEEVTK